MALSLWLASLKSDVTAVTPVQASIHAALTCNGIEAVDVTGVTDGCDMVTVETPVTAGENQALQPQPAWALGRTPVTPVTAERINADGQTTEPASTPTQSEPKRIFRKRGPWLTGLEPMDAQSYNAHHFNCPFCIAAGRSTQYGTRCTVGLALWATYTVETLNVATA